MKVAAFAFGDDPSAPGGGSKTVTPSNTAPIWTDEVARALVVFSDGTVTFTGADGADDTWTFTTDMSYPQVIDVAVTHVKATGTTVQAGDIKALR